LLISLGIFLFAAATQYGRLQFNSGVRYVVPAVPFLFFIAAGILIRLPRVIAVLLGVSATYWSWCLAMYRDVEQAGGVFDSFIHVSTEGLRLPWLTTLQNLGLVSSNLWAAPLLATAAAIILVLWKAKIPNLALRFGATAQNANLIPR
jgi:hypothetical protein